ncbi:MAG: hypothetical protein L0154_12845, partial [Chloroflexi bacterium]|nr:hypothetical protein [Chloroflexota bacterium]
AESTASVGALDKSGVVVGVGGVSSLLSPRQATSMTHKMTEDNKKRLLIMTLPLRFDLAVIVTGQSSNDDRATRSL